MGQIKILNSFKSTPKDSGGESAIKFSTKIRNFSSAPAITTTTSSNIEA